MFGTKAKRIVLLVLSVLFMFSLATAVLAAEKAPIDFGKDKNKMHWYLLDFGTKDDSGYAIVRKYYTNPDEKTKTIDLIASKFGIAHDRAAQLYFTEYGYTYSPDGTRFGLTYVTHYDMLGTEIKSTTFDGATIALEKLSKDTIPHKTYQYIIGKNKPQTAKKPVAAAKRPAQKKTPAKKPAAVKK